MDVSTQESKPQTLQLWQFALLSAAIFFASAALFRFIVQFTAGRPQESYGFVTALIVWAITTLALWGVITGIRKFPRAEGVLIPTAIVFSSLAVASFWWGIITKYFSDSYPFYAVFDGWGPLAFMLFTVPTHAILLLLITRWRMERNPIDNKRVLRFCGTTILSSGALLVLFIYLGTQCVAFSATQDSTDYVAYCRTNEIIAEDDIASCDALSGELAYECRTEHAMFWARCRAIYDPERREYCKATLEEHRNECEHFKQDTPTQIREGYETCLWEYGVTAEDACQENATSTTRSGHVFQKECHDETYNGVVNSSGSISYSPKITVFGRFCDLPNEIGKTYLNTTCAEYRTREFP